jgi:hypothetical protein
MGLYLNSILDNTTMFFIFLNYLGMEYFYIKLKKQYLVLSIIAYTIWV